MYLNSPGLQVCQWQQALHRKWHGIVARVICIASRGGVTQQRHVVDEASLGRVVCQDASRVIGAGSGARGVLIVVQPAEVHTGKYTFVYNNATANLVQM